MSYDVQVRRAAELDIAEAQIWYETQDTGLALSSVLKSRGYLIDSRERRTSIRLSIATFAEQSFADFLIWFGIASQPRL